MRQAYDYWQDQPGNYRERWHAPRPCRHRGFFFKKEENLRRPDRHARTQQTSAQRQTALFVFKRQVSVFLVGLCVKPVRCPSQSRTTPRVVVSEKITPRGAQCTTYGRATVCHIFCSYSQSSFTTPHENLACAKEHTQGTRVVEETAIVWHLWSTKHNI